jgi:hypothetical protein
MDTTQNINSFFSSAVVADFARDYLFRVESLVFDGGLVLTPDEMIYAKTATLPAREIVNQEVKAYGQTFNIPGSSQFPNSANYEIDFYCPEDSSIRELLMNESTRTFGNIFGIAGSGVGGGSIASANSRITLIQLDKNLDALYKYELIGANIRNVGEISYDMAGGNGAVMSFKVSIAYHFPVRTAMNGDVVPVINQ